MTNAGPHILQLWQSNPAVQRAAASFGSGDAVIETAIAIQQIPAPTFHEGRRAAFVHEQFARIGLTDRAIDEIGNVYGRIVGKTRAPGLLIAAHLDTVFAESTDLAVRREGQRVYGPGLGDNSLGVGGLLHLAAALGDHAIVPGRDIWFVANVGEEGLGDLRGMRAALARLQGQIGTAIALEGTGHDRIVHEAIGVRRYRIMARAAGGHSWQNFGAPSAVHTLVRLADRLTRLDLPNARSSYNIGVIEGGSSVNAIAERASLLLDLRSVEPEALAGLVRQVEKIIAGARLGSPDVRIDADVVGDRPAGRIGRDHPLVQLATAAYTAAGAHVSYGVGSTDANVPLSQGIPAICVGVADGANAHRLDEYIDISRVGNGMRALLWLVLAATNG